MYVCYKRRLQTFLKLGGNATSACQICDLLTFFKEIKVSHDAMLNVLPKTHVDVNQIYVKNVCAQGSP